MRYEGGVILCLPRSRYLKMNTAQFDDSKSFVAEDLFFRLGLTAPSVTRWLALFLDFSWMANVVVGPGLARNFGLREPTMTLRISTLISPKSELAPTAASSSYRTNHTNNSFSSIMAKFFCVRTIHTCDNKFWENKISQKPLPNLMALLAVGFMRAYFVEFSWTSKAVYNYSSRCRGGRKRVYPINDEALSIILIISSTL